MRSALVFSLLWLSVGAFAGASSPVWYKITEEQKTALEALLNQQIKQLSEVKDELSLSESQRLEALKRLEIAETSLKESENQTRLLEADLTKSRTQHGKALESLQKLEQTQVIDRITWGAGGLLVGFGLGFLAGLLFH